MSCGHSLPGSGWISHIHWALFLQPASFSSSRRHSRESGCLKEVLSTAIGFIGALLGPWVARQLHLVEPFILSVGGYSFPILWSIIGGALFVAFLHLLSGRRRIWS